MHLIAILAETYSGYKADEYPSCFYWDGKRFDVREVVDRWHQGYADSDESDASYFKVLAADDNFYILRHEMKSDRWYLVV